MTFSRFNLIIFVKSCFGFASVTLSIFAYTLNAQIFSFANLTFKVTLYTDQCFRSSFMVVVFTFTAIILINSVRKFIRGCAIKTLIFRTAITCETRMVTWIAFTIICRINVWISSFVAQTLWLFLKSPIFTRSTSIFPAFRTILTSKITWQSRTSFIGLIWSISTWFCYTCTSFLIIIRSNISIFFITC